MKRAGYVFFFGLASISVGTLGLQGCGSSSSGNTGGSGGTTSTTSSSSTTTTSSSTTSSSTTTSSSSGAALTCTAYCTEIIANCTGSNQQYGASATDNGMANCMGYCTGAFTTLGTPTDATGATLGCHFYHGGAPSMTAPSTHCVHAGPTGGDKSVDGGVGTCGEPCAAFCAGALSICTGANAQYTSMSDCMTKCATFAPDPAPYLSTDTTLQSANTIGCRIYHLTAAAASSAAATTHCPHIAVVSSFCKN